MTQQLPIDLSRLNAEELMQLERLLHDLYPNLRKAPLNEDHFGAWLNRVSPNWNWNWKYLVLLREALHKITTGQLRRLMIFMPPRHGKSELVTVRYPVYRLDMDPAIRVAVGCYNQRFAERFGRKARRLARELFPLAQDRAAVVEWETELGGVYRACGVGSPPTGEGFNLLILDDPVKSRQEAESASYRDRVYDWYTDDLYSRLEPDAAMILIQTRWHVDDLAGRILNSTEAHDWHVISLPAIAEENDPLGRKPGEALCPERYDLEALNKIKSVLRDSFDALYQQRPKKREGNLFKEHWFAPFIPSDSWDAWKIPSGAIIPRNQCTVFLALDPATGKGAYGDHSAIGVFAAAPHQSPSLLFVLDMLAAKIPLEDLPKETNRLAMKWNADYIAVEANGFQQAVVEAIRKVCDRPVQERLTGARSKLVRAIPAITKASAGEILIPALAQLRWIDQFIEEITSFTGAGDEHDDQVDVLSMAVAEASRFIMDAAEQPFAFGGRAKR